MTNPRPEFLSLQSGGGGPFTSDDDSNQSPIQPHLDTLFAEFTRSHQRSTPPPRTPTTARRTRASLLIQDVVEQKVDLRALDYVSDYDSHLMCPICHVPFVDPVVLDCDHTFCNLCFDEYREGAENSPRTQCPTCRAYLLARPHKASRLIVNMCNDIKVRCPNADCEAVHPRGCVEQHVTKECPEYPLDCPGADCENKVKRKNFVPDTCIHSSHVECDCGAVIELGRGEWLRHKDEECPATGVKCDTCSTRIPVKEYLSGRDRHVCQMDPAQLRCPGYDYGCTDTTMFATQEDLEYHTQTCPFARLAPTLNKQSQLLTSLTDQLTLTKVRNEVLETSLDKITDMLNTRIVPFLPTHPPSSRAASPTPSSLSIEEIPRHSDPSNPHSLSLPAHLRPLTPHQTSQPATTINELDMLNLHTHLSDSITNLSTQLLSLQNNLADLDARQSMMVMNETLRLKEDLAQQGAGLFSTRAQVQWLLNRERDRMQMQQMQMAAAAQQQQQQQQQVSSTSAPGAAHGQGQGQPGGGPSGNPDHNQHQHQQQRPGMPRGRSNNAHATSYSHSHGFNNGSSDVAGIGAGVSIGVLGSGATAGGSSSSTRSSFSNGTSAGEGVGVGVSVSPRMGPRVGNAVGNVGRRLSGSQERVKL